MVDMGTENVSALGGEHVYSPPDPSQAGIKRNEPTSAWSGI